MGKKALRRQDLVERVTDCVVHHHGIRGLTLQGVAEATGVSLWALRYSFDNVDRLFRAVVAASVSRIVDRLRYEAATRPAVVDSIQEYADFLAAAMQSDEYRNFLYLVIRNGSDQQWLREAYERQVLGVAAQDAERIVRAAGEAHGAHILLRPGAAIRFVKRIEAELVLPALLPPFQARAADEAGVAALLKAISRELFEATYLFEWEAASAA